jgi:outer membrane murein-binding lipoprotein Lpp
MSFTEHMEHAAHSGHHGGHGHDDQGATQSRRIGITMAILGVLLALCSAMLGGARSKMMETMVTQAEVAAKVQAISTKHRTLMAQLQQLHALLPTDEAAETASENKISEIQKANLKSAFLPVIDVTRLETARILNTVTPSAKDILRFVTLARDYDKEKLAAQAWHESFAPVITAHEHGAHHFEWALLCAEFGIVLCSIALLLSNRKLWIGAIVLGALGYVLAGWSVVSYHSALAVSEVTVSGARAVFDHANGTEARRVDDEKLLTEIETIEKREAAHAAKAP